MAAIMILRHVLTPIRAAQVNKQITFAATVGQKFDANSIKIEIEIHLVSID